jgi:hypothetical protein
MNRDLNMIVIQFHKSYQDTREVFYFILKNFQKQKHIIFRYSALILFFINGKTTFCLKRIFHFVSSILLIIFFILLSQTNNNQFTMLPLVVNTQKMITNTLIILLLINFSWNTLGYMIVLLDHVLMQILDQESQRCLYNLLFCFIYIYYMFVIVIDITIIV